MTIQSFPGLTNNQSVQPRQSPETTAELADFDQSQKETTVEKSKSSCKFLHLVLNDMEHDLQIEVRMFDDQQFNMEHSDSDDRVQSEDWPTADQIQTYTKKMKKIKPEITP